MANPEFAKALAARFAVVHTRRNTKPGNRRRLLKTLSRTCSILTALVLAGYFMPPFKAIILNMSPVLTGQPSYSSGEAAATELAEPSGSASQGDFKDIGRLLGSGRPLVLPSPPPRAQEDSGKAASALSSRVCGSPANEGYARLVYPLTPSSSCLAQSPTTLWHLQNPVAGKQNVLEPRYEKNALYDGLTVAWGHTNKKASVEECAAQCLHFKTAQGLMQTGLPCNVFAFCPDGACWEPDQPKPDVSAQGSCWLKFTEAPANPEVILRSTLPGSMRAKHKDAPKQANWQTGVLLPPGVSLRNGTYSPRHWW